MKHKMNHFLISSLLAITLLSAQNSVYSQDSVLIGKQIWSTKNLNLDRYRNGDPIPEAKTAAGKFQVLRNGICLYIILAERIMGEKN